MYNACVSSTLSLKCKCASFSFNGYSYCTNDRFIKYPLFNSSSSSCCCCCCANSMCRVSLSPSYVPCLRQSTLIQCKKVILRGLDRCSSYSYSPVYGIERKICYEKSGSFRRGGRFGCVGFEEKSERPSLCDLDETEALLSLLCEDLDEEFVDSRGSDYGARKKRFVEIKENKGNDVKKRSVERKAKYEIDSDEEFVDLRESNDRSRTKRVVEIKDNDVKKRSEERKAKYEIELDEEKMIKENRRERQEHRNAHEVLRGNLVIKSDGSRARREGKEASLSSEEREYLSRKEHRREREKEQRNAREVVRGNLVIKSHDLRSREEGKEASLSREEGEYLSRKSNVERARKEEREEDLRQKVRRESSCSSYYSVSSAGELESDNEMEIGEEEQKIHGELSRTEEFSHYGEVGERVERTETSSKRDTSVECDWRKSSEKRLEENEFKKESLSVHESKYDDRKQNNQAMRLQQRRNDEQLTEKSETRVKHKRYPAETKARVEETRGENYKRTDIVQREDESRKHSQEICKLQIHEVDVRGEFTKESDSSIRKKSSEVSSSRGESYKTTDIIRREDKSRKRIEEVDVRGEFTKESDSSIRKKSSEVSSSRGESYKTTDIIRREDESRKQIQEVDVRAEFTKESDSSIRKKSSEVSSSTKSQKLARDEHILRSYVSERQSETRLTNQEEYKSRFLKSSLESREQSSQTSVEDTRIMEYSKGSEQNEMNKRKSQVYSSSSPLLPSSSTVEPMSEDSQDRPHRMQQEIYGEKPLELVSPEDGLGSANRLHEYSAEYVGGFVEKARHEISSSEIEREKRSSETKLVFEGEQHKHEESQPKEQDPTSSKGPSDEMWVTQASAPETSPSVQETTGAEPKDDAKTAAESAVIKRPAQSMWHIIADIVRLRWISHSAKHTSTSGSGARSSSHQSSSSGEGVKNGKSSLPKNPYDQHKKEKIQTLSQGEVSNSSKSRDQVKPEWEEAPSSIEPSRSISLASNEETLQKSVETASTGTLTTEFSSPVSAMPERSPAPSSSGTERVVPSASTEISISQAKDGEVRQRKFQRANQVMKDRFEEWEEAYRIEAEQRKADEMFMREALVEAKKAASYWEVPVGAVLVQDGKIIARGCNLVEELRDSTAHAEMICIREASNVLRSWRLSETTLYVTLEPCPMCAGAILQARIDTVVWGAPNKLLGADGSWIRLFPDGEGIGSGQQPTDKPPAPVHPFHPKMTIRRGVLASECADAMQQFFQLRRKKEKKSEPQPTSSPSSHPPVSSHPNKFLAKMHDAFHLMFCL